MNIFLDNVNLSDTGGPNHFGQKLRTYINKEGHFCEPIANSSTDVQLTFIETLRRYFFRDGEAVPLVQRLDGIYYNLNDGPGYQERNRIIQNTYNDADGVIFQSNFNKELTFSFFGPHDNYTVINNGADIELINKINPSNHKIFKDHENVWCCASHWRPGKRLQENIDYFLENSGKDDCLIVAGPGAHATISTYKSTPKDEQHIFSQMQGVERFMGIDKGKLSLRDFRRYLIHLEKTNLPGIDPTPSGMEILHHPRIFRAGNLDVPTLLSIFKASKYFIHLAYIDHCPNVVVDARASGCEIICSSTGGTKEIAGTTATVIQEEEWDLKPLDLVETPKMDLSKKVKNNIDSNLDMSYVAKNYINFLTKVTEKKNG